MSDRHAAVHWVRTSSDFAYNTYNRAHEMRFKDGAIALAASAAPAFRGDSGRVDPEEAYVASLSSCHMLTFLAICARKRLTVDAYDDDAVGRLEKGADGKLWLAQVTLTPRVTFGAGVEVNAGQLDDLHHHAHEECFIASSVRTVIDVRPRAPEPQR
jgi:organic hydroperoxide reductase OsmC/OhrA